MNNLWVFGDSFSTPFSHYQQYCDFKGYTPKTYYELMAFNIFKTTPFFAHSSLDVRDWKNPV